MSEKLIDSLDDHNVSARFIQDEISYSDVSNTSSPTTETHTGLHLIQSTSSGGDDLNATFNEQPVSQDILARKTILHNMSYSDETSENSLELKHNFSTQNPLSAFMDFITGAFHGEGGTSLDEGLSNSYPLSGDDVSTEYTTHIENAFTNISNIFSNTSIYDSLTNSTFNSSNNGSLFLSSDLITSGQTPFNFDLTTWLTLTPQSTSEVEDDSFQDVDIDPSFIIVKVLVLALISLVGSCGNLLVIWSVIKESHLHRPPFYFLLSLGVTDLSRAVFCLPVVITTVLHGSKWRHGESACKLFAFATSFFVFSSALSLLAIAIDRHISIVYSKTYRRRSLGIANLVVAIIIWVIAFSVSFPPVVGVGDYVFIPDEAQCAYQHKHYRYNDSVSSVLVFVAILFLTYFLYFRIFRFLRAHRRMRPLQHTPALSSNWAFVGPGANGQAFINWLNGFGGQAPVRQGGQRTVQRLNFGRVINLSTAKNEHLTRLFLVLTVVFGVAWSPYVILSVWRIFFDASLIPSSYVTVSAWLGYGQLAMCPVVYFLARGPTKKPSRTTYAQAEKREFLLENKIGK